MQKADPLAEARLADFRPLLLDRGFTEAPLYPGHFYRMDTTMTAFAVNIDPIPDGVSVTYGWDSVTDSRGQAAKRPFVLTYGCLGIQLNEQFHLSHGEDATTYAPQIQALYAAHRGTEKEALSALSRKLRAERKKEIIARVTAQVKSLGLRRRGANWDCSLTENVQLRLSLTCSSWEEAYGLELSACVGDESPGCWFVRTFDLPGEHKGRFDWRITPLDKSEAYIRRVADCIQDLLHAPLNESTFAPSVWTHSPHRQDLCASCGMRERCPIKKGASPA